ncbi:hypothetical protein P43SY_007253 [Pythium insidiosum]|uniref:Uncharacterized protein n=1 Tax=Pythium insidiosum TaxID=114742 RepID=A0AAD5Q3B5_PYTIN|nr:hypothetical protein P43SY_007253 [Pythium insidiosum]
MRPVSTVEDHGLVAILRYVTEDICKVKMGVPKRNTVRDRIVHLAEDQRHKLRDLLEKEFINDLSIAELHADDDRFAENEVIIARLQEDAVVAVEEHVETEMRDRPSSVEALTYVRTIVGEFRDLAVYFHRSSKGKSYLMQLQRKSGKSTPLTTIVDCPTRWNSTYDMIERLFELKDYLSRFFTHLGTPEGKEEFKDVKRRDPIGEEKWCVVDGLRTLLKPFMAVTSIENKLEEENLFGIHASPVPPYIEKLQDTRRTMLRLFRERFEQVKRDLLWTTYLNPRFPKVPVFSAQEEQDAFDRIVNELVDMAEGQPCTPDPQVGLISPDPTPQKEDAELLNDIFFYRQSESAPASQLEFGLRQRLHAEFLLIDN